MSGISHKESITSSEELLFATFIIDDLEFAIDVKYVRDAITCPEHITPLPFSPDYISGIIDLRDFLIPIINTRARFKIDNGDDHARGHIAITCCNDRFMGLTFDSISEVIRIKSDCIETLAPEFQNEKDLVSDVIKLDHGNRLVQIINPLALFDYQDLPAELLNRNRVREEVKNISTRRQLVSFSLNNQLFGIHVEHIQEIITVPEINQRMLVEQYIKGVISLREELISIIDLRQFLDGGEANRVNSESRIIILCGEHTVFGILVDSIKEVITYEQDDLQDMPPWSGNRHQGGFSNVLEIAEQSIVILNTQNLFKDVIARLEANNELHDDSQTTLERDDDNKSTEDKKDFNSNTYITFELDEVYGVEIRNIREIVKYENNIRKLPGQAHWVQGILNLRSEVIPVINLRQYMTSKKPGGNEKMIMVFILGGRQVGIIIDRLLEIRTLADNQGNIPKLLTQRKGLMNNKLIEKIVNIEEQDGSHSPVIILNIEQLMQDTSGEKDTVIENSNQQTPETEFQPPQEMADKSTDSLEL